MHGVRWVWLQFTPTVYGLHHQNYQFNLCFHGFLFYSSFLPFFFFFVAFLGLLMYPFFHPASEKHHETSAQ